MRIPLVGPSNTAFSVAAAAERSMNCYLETISPGNDGKSRYVLRGRPGMRLFTTMPGSPIRGLFGGGGRLFVASGTSFTEVNESGSTIGPLSSIANDGLPVDILPNGNQLFVVSAGLSYADGGVGLVQNVLPSIGGQCTTLGKLVLLESTPNSSTGQTDSFDAGMVGQTMTINGSPFIVASILNPGALNLTTSAGLLSFKDWTCLPVMNAGRGAFLDGRFVINRPASRQFNLSNLLDGSTWDPLMFALKEGYPDNLAAVWSEPPLLYPLGTETMEAWRDTGAADFPFERVDGGFARIGLASTWSPVSIMGKLHMLAGGSYGQVVAVRMEGVTPVRISTHAVEDALKDFAFPSQGVAFSYVDNGHWLWCINFTGGPCWVYDYTESAAVGSPQWHERGSWDGSEFGQYVPWFHTFIPEWGANGMHIVGDGGSGKLYELNAAYFDDDGADIRCLRALPYVYNDGNWIFHQRFEVELETGTAGTPPVVTLDWSDDRGQTFGTELGVGTVRTLGPGVTGVFTTRYFTRALGRSRGRVYRIAVTGKGRVAIIDAALEATMGTA